MPKFSRPLAVFGPAFCAAALTVAGSAAAAPAPAATPVAARGVSVVHAAAQVTVIPEDRADVAVAVTPGAAALPAPRVRTENGRVIVDGGLDGRIRSCRGGAKGLTGVVVSGVGPLTPAALPTITIRTPRNVDLMVGGAVVTKVGPATGGTMRFRGCGNATIATVDGPLAVSLEGSGDVDVADVRGALNARLDGSGDIRVGAVGAAALALNGSGDLTVAKVTGSLDARLDGSGDLTVAAIDAPSARMALDGSGDLTVGAGRAATLVVSVDGSGDARFGGRAGAVTAELDGSGDIVVEGADRVEAMRKSGSGDIKVGR
ncbi:MAG: DUF2807 domain-containing protein [Alphaproteobacteria bacterium]|nr:DUF2807 domain-containing protein [Alphaproteobacteria bacterium]